MTKVIENTAEKSIRQGDVISPKLFILVLPSNSTGTTSIVYISTTMALTKKMVERLRINQKDFEESYAEKNKSDRY